MQTENGILGVRHTFSMNMAAMTGVSRARSSSRMRSHQAVLMPSRVLATLDLHACAAESVGPESLEH